MGASHSASEPCSTTWKCHPVKTTPTLDADHSDWADVEAYTSSLLMISGSEYAEGGLTAKCQYDSENIYFAFEIPGKYRFSATDNHLCAAIATMFKVGSKATYTNMGGCPDAISGCPDGVPDTCSDYRVDIGAHWELATTEQRTLYPVNSTATAGTGNDPIANKDDEYAVSAQCRFDDDDANAGNEWAGAWAHTSTSATEGEDGTYHFEMSRLLKTPSSVTDAQLTAGETYEFGVAYWDPYQATETGWTAIGHYITGCASKWIELELVSDQGGDTAAGGANDSSSPSFGLSSMLAALAVGSSVVSWM